MNLSGPDFRNLTGDGDIPMTVEATMFVALEFLTKRFEGQSLMDTVKQI